MKCVIALVVVLCFVACSSALCDSWGVRQCGIDYLNCTESIQPSTNTTGPLCSCYEAEGKCLKKYDCYDAAPYYVFHYDCLASKCSEVQCGSSSILSVSILLSFFLVAFSL